MIKHFLILCSLVLIGSCTQKEECTNYKILLEMYRNIALNQIIPVEIPKEVDYSREPQYSITVTINEENEYIVDGELYDFDELVLVIESRDSSDAANNVLRIVGHRHAHYEAVFKLMAYADHNGLKTSLAYQKE